MKFTLILKNKGESQFNSFSKSFDVPELKNDQVIAFANDYVKKHNEENEQKIALVSIDRNRFNGKLVLN